MKTDLMNRAMGNQRSLRCEIDRVRDRWVVIVKPIDLE